MPDEPITPPAPTDQPNPTEDEDLDVGEPGDDGRYPAEIVTKLRQEAADRRTKARDADEARSAAEHKFEAAVERLWELSRVQATAGILADPTDLLGSVDMLDDDGLPDGERIKTAAEELAKAKPHLATRRPSGDVDQGPRADTPEPVNLAEVVRRAAG